MSSPDESVGRIQTIAHYDLSFTDPVSSIVSGPGRKGIRLLYGIGIGFACGFALHSHHSVRRSETICVSKPLAQNDIH